MQTYKVYLDISNTVGHIGSDVHGIGVENVSEYAHSDTLFSAIVHGLAHSFEIKRVDDMFDQFRKYNLNKQITDLPFRCSSAFLSAGKIEYVPRPLCPPPFEYPASILNKVAFLPSDSLASWFAQGPEQWTPWSINEYVQSIIDSYESGYKNSFIERVRAVNARDRMRNLTQVYNRGEIIYAEDVALYFYLDVQESWEEPVKQALQSMTKWHGLGGEISIGFSTINSVRVEQQPSEKPTPGTHSYLLSLYPLELGINYQKSYYDLVLRKSWINSPYIHKQMKKKNAYLLREGSCIAVKQLAGKLLDVTPSAWESLNTEPGWHRIYRNGIGYGIAVNLF